MKRIIILAVLAIPVALAGCAVLAKSNARTTAERQRTEMLSSMRGRLEWLAANPAVAAGVDPALPYRDLLRNLDELEGLPE